MKLTKPQINQHNKACELLKKERLSWDDKMFVLENWREDANNINSSFGAFFTPYELAQDAMIEMGGYEKSIVDLCSGIGALALAASMRNENAELTCVELNPEYVNVGRKIVPQANWICGSIFDFDFSRKFDLAISNPPFGFIKSGKNKNDGLGGFEFSTLLLASKIANEAIFILPQLSTPYLYSSRNYFEDLTGKNNMPNKVKSFIKKTGIEYQFNCGIDTGYYKNTWHGVSPICEVCCFDFQSIKTMTQGQLL